MIISKERYEVLKDFSFRKHNNDFTCETSSMDKDGKYTKTYVFEDGFTWYEVIRPVYEKAKVVVKEFTVIDVEVKLLEVEFWNTDNSGSRKYYEKF